MPSHLLPYTFLFVSLLSATADSFDGFTVDLLHRDSPKSPYYNFTATPYDRLYASTRRTLSRVELLSSANGSFQSSIIPDAFEYLMTLSIGTPSTKLLLIADTGSDLTWTQCKPCTNCFKQHTASFDPKKSATYKSVTCQSTVCKYLINTDCSPNGGRCLYSILYGDQSSSKGILSYETFSMEATSDNSAVLIPNIVFGCSYLTSDAFGNNSAGLVGLGRGPSSLITQLSSTINGKFSYCLVPTTNLSATSVMSFGNRAIVGGSEVVSTSLIDGPESTFYYVTLEEIIVGDGVYKITVNPGDDGEGSSSVPWNMIVDSGTTFTLLDELTLVKLETKLSSIIKLPSVSATDLFRLCFNSTELSAGDLPEITFGFTGAAVKLKPANTFVKAAEGVLCLAMLPYQQMIFGNIAQQNFHVGFDLVANKIFFAPADCANL